MKCDWKYMAIYFGAMFKRTVIYHLSELIFSTSSLRVCLCHRIGSVLALLMLAVGVYSDALDEANVAIIICVA